MREQPHKTLSFRSGFLKKNLGGNRNSSALNQLKQWEANLRVLNITEIKTVPEIPWSHPFIERLIGTIRRECLDRLLFWTATDLEAKLDEFRRYYNEHRTHGGLNGRLPNSSQPEPISFASYRWQKHCRGLYQTPTAA